MAISLILEYFLLLLLVTRFNRNKINGNLQNKVSSVPCNKGIMNYDSYSRSLATSALCSDLFYDCRYHTTLVKKDSFQKDF